MDKFSCSHSFNLQGSIVKTITGHWQCLVRRICILLALERGYKPLQS